MFISASIFIYMYVHLCVRGACFACMRICNRIDNNYHEMILIRKVYHAAGCDELFLTGHEKGEIFAARPDSGRHKGKNILVRGHRCSFHSTSGTRVSRLQIMITALRSADRFAKFADQPCVSANIFKGR